MPGGFRSQASRYGIPPCAITRPTYANTDWSRPYGYSSVGARRGRTSAAAATRAGAPGAAAALGAGVTGAGRRPTLPVRRAFRSPGKAALRRGRKGRGNLLLRPAERGSGVPARHLVLLGHVQAEE